jgi:hypothetical protein
MDDDHFFCLLKTRLISHQDGSPDYLHPVVGYIQEDNIDEVTTCFRCREDQHDILYYLLYKKKYVARSTQVSANFVRFRYDMFNCLIELEEFDVDCRNRDGSTLLMTLTGPYHDRKVSLKLLEKGADIHLTDSSGSTLLHCAVREESSDNLLIGSLVIEKGAEINCRADNGETPLHVACHYGNVDWVHTLLYHGADPNIPCNNGIIPLAAMRYVPEETQIALQDILLPYTLDFDNATLSLSSMVEAMISPGATFPKLLEKVLHLNYNIVDLEYFVENLSCHIPIYLRMFVEKFGNVVNDLINNYDILVLLLVLIRTPGQPYACSNLKGIFDAFLKSDQGPKFVQASDPSFPAISHLIQVFNSHKCMHVEEEELSKTAHLMLTYGLGVTSEDLDTVYRFYGSCDLFRLLLRMDVQFCDGHTPLSIVMMYCDPSTDLEMCLSDSSSIANLLDYFDHPKLKELCLLSTNNETATRAKELPPVPLLVELARNAARKYIARNFKIQTPKLFYSVLDRLPIDRRSKSIIALETKLY